MWKKLVGNGQLSIIFVGTQETSAIDRQETSRDAHKAASLVGT